MFGFVILGALFIPAMMETLLSLGTGAAALKIGTTVIRGFSLIACGFFAWFKPSFTNYAAWLVLVACVIGGAGDMVYSKGIVEGFQSLMPMFYYMVAAHLIIALFIQYSVKKYRVA
jgi:hypothetical protein